MNTKDLRARGEELYGKFLDELVRINRQGAMPEKRHASSVLTAEVYINQLHLFIPGHGFEDPDVEVLFFKSIKPLFTGQQEYHQHLYHASVFGIAGNGLWEHELRRMKKILSDHSEFATYMHGGHTYNDRSWFTQRRAPMPTTLCINRWETNPQYTSARDSWVGGLMAVECYCEWLNSKIDNLIVK